MQKCVLTTIFTLINPFTCFFYIILITLLISEPPSWKDGSFRWKDWWLLPLFSFFHVSYLQLKVRLRSDRGGEEGGLHRYDSISTTIYIFIYYSGPIFVKLSKDFNLSCYLRLLWRKKKSQWNTWNLKRPSIKLVYKLARFFIFHIVFKFILKLFCLFLWLTKGT